jgi:mono/diheme cytochrome c family protein
MKKFLKVLGYVLGGLMVLVLGFYVYVQATYERDYSSVPLPNIVASKDPEVIAQGEYIVNAVAHCSACHGTTPGSKKVDFSHPLSGGFDWDIPLFGHFVAANITPDDETGIGKMSDGQVARAVRSAVARDGRIAPFMLLGVGDMSDEDLTAVVSWLRVQKPVNRKNDEERWGFFAKMLAGNFTPRTNPPLKHVPPGEPSVERGRYLAEGPARCEGCHSPFDVATMTPKGAPFSGSSEAEPDFQESGFEFVVPNLTPDKESGHITGWSEDQFVARLKGGRVFAGSKMPWDNFGRMTESDMRSIYRFLRTLPPTKHVIGPTHRKVGGE